MITRRQFCGVLGGTMLGGATVEAVFAHSLSVIEEKCDSQRVQSDYFASKIHLERWLQELRHKSVQSRLDELRKRFAEIRTRSEAVLLIPGERGESAFQDDLTREAKESGLRIFSPPGNVEHSLAVLEEIHADSSEFMTLAFPLEEAGDRIQIIAPSSSQMASGYFYARFFHRSAVSIPLAIILFEASRCHWETYISRGLLQGLSYERLSRKSRTISRDCVDYGYARLIDQTRVGSINHNKKRDHK